MSKHLIYRTLSVLSLLAALFSSCQSTRQEAEALSPDENRFTTTVLSQPGALDEPMAFTFLNAEEMLIVERKGAVKAFDVNSQQVKQVGFVPVNTKYVNKEGESREAEEGLMGIVAHPGYERNNWIFLLYADPEEPKHVLARWEYRDGQLQDGTRQVVLEYPAQREVCCHTGGGMVFDRAGNLYITTGNNTANPPRGTSNLDERPGYENADDQRTAGNTNDLRGKILRIHPEDDGSYTIPAGNLFPEGTPGARPEIYTMGHRNPWRISLDSRTGYIYWGEVGPDASADTEYGPRGYDEFNQAKGPGFFGWPYFIGDNQPYVDYDFETETLGQPFDPAAPRNDSPNNTGLTDLPPPQPAFLWYPYGASEEFPLMGSAGRSATGGPVFRLADFPASDRRFPAYYEGKWLIVEFMRGWIMAVTMDENGDYAGMEPFLPQENFSSAIDMQFSPDGDLYVLEYGSAWFRGNQNAQVKRIRYNGGNRAPVVAAGADKTAGALPLTVRLSSDGTVDYDGDPLTYEWTVRSGEGFSKTFREANPGLTLKEAGRYEVQLTVTDTRGNRNAQSFEITAGNEPPLVDIQITEGNQSFFFPGSTLRYNIVVEDKEDGSLRTGEIAEEAVAVNFDYVPEGFDPIGIAQNHRAADDWVVFSKGRALIDGSDCLACHRLDISSIGPSYRQVAEKYPDNPDNRALLAGRIINGSVGTWGEHAMSAHPNLSRQDAELMVEYILSLDDPQPARPALALAGTHTPEAPPGDPGRGGYLLRAAYTDRGAGNLGPIAAEKIIALRRPVLDPEQADDSKGLQILTTPNRSINIVEDQAYLGFRGLDLSGIREIAIEAEAPARTNSPGGVVELRLGSPTGALIGSTEPIAPLEIDYRAELEKLRKAWEEGGRKGPRPGFRTVRELFKPKYVIPLEPIQGRHDLYFVIRNPEAKAGEILIQFDGIEFRNTGAAM